MVSLNLKGVLPAAILPMTADFEPDFEAFATYLDWLIAEGAIGLAINMDTGEGPQLNPAERRRAAEVAADVARNRCVVVAGVMGGTTHDAVEISKMYRSVGVDGLVVFPNAAFRNVPLDPSVAHSYHQAIAQATGLPLVLFQLAPVFGGVNYTRETLLRLIEIPEVVAIKEASFDAQYFSCTKQTLDQASRPITLLTGNDRFITESFMIGAEGALLGFCAIGCGVVAQQLKKFQAGDWEAAVGMRTTVQEFADSIYHDPVLDYRARCKVALAHVGVIESTRTFVRPPMLQVDSEESEKIRAALDRVGLLKVH